MAPHTVNLTDPDPHLLGGLVMGQPRRLPEPGPTLAALNNSFGFGGANCSLLFTAWGAAESSAI